MMRKHELHINAFAGPAKCPKNGANVTVYLSRVKIKSNNRLKLNYDCASKGDCNETGYCPFRDPYPDSQ